MIESLSEIIARANREAGVLRPCVSGCGLTVAAPANVCEQCAAKRVRNRRQLSVLETIPESLRWSSFLAQELRQRVANPDLIARAHAGRDAPRVVLVGPAGTGKSSLATAMFRARVEALPDLSAVFAPAWRIGVARARSEGSEPELVGRCERCDLLVIDDLGSERPIPSNPIPDLIFERHAEDRATWVTTWMSPRQVSERYGDGIARRIFERAFVIDCSISGASI